MTAWVQSLFDEEPEEYGPKEPSKATNAGPLRARGAQPKGMNSDAGRVWASGERMAINPIGAPPLDWWNISEEEVRRRLILAMCPERVCRTCGEPSRRIVEKEYDRTLAPVGDARQAWAVGAGQHAGVWEASAPTPTSVAESWSDCGHDDWRPGVVLDPFAGAS